MTASPDNEERLLRLEQSNRRLKLGICAATIIVAAGCLVGFATQEPRTIKASSFILLDDAGNERAELSSAGKAVSLKLLNQNGTQAIKLAAEDGANALAIADQSGQVRTSLTVDPQTGTSLTIMDQAGLKRADLMLKDDFATAWVSDANGTIRAAMSDFGFITFRERGTIAWKDDVYTQDIKRMTDYVQQKLQPPRH